MNRSRLFQNKPESADLESPPAEVGPTIPGQTNSPELRAKGSKALPWVLGFLAFIAICGMGGWVYLAERRAESVRQQAAHAEERERSERIRSQEAEQKAEAAQEQTDKARQEEAKAREQALLERARAADAKLEAERQSRIAAEALARQAQARQSQPQQTGAEDDAEYTTLAHYAAFISEHDYRNSKGVALGTIGEVLQQDRANAHTRGNPDKDELEGYFTTLYRRSAIPNMPKNLTVSVRETMRRGEEISVWVDVLRENSTGEISMKVIDRQIKAE